MTLTDKIRVNCYIVAINKDKEPKLGSLSIIFT